MHRLIEADPHNREAIFPYIGGEEVNTSPTHAHHRYVINFHDYPLRREEAPMPWADMDKQEREECLRSGRAPDDYPNPVAADWPDLLTIVKQRVKPERMVQKDQGGKEKWWQFMRARPGLHTAIANLERVLVISRYGQIAAFTFLPAGAVYSDSIIACPFATYAALCALQSRPHEIWARFLGSSMKDDLRYTPLRLLRDLPVPQPLAQA